MESLDYVDYLDVSVKQLLQAAYKDVDSAIDSALKHRGLNGADCKERLSVWSTEGNTVYMLDNKPIVTVSKPQLGVIGTSYRVYFNIEQHFDVQLEIRKRYLAVNGSVVKITAKISGDVYYGAGMYFNKHGKVGKGLDSGYNLIKEWKE